MRELLRACYYAIDKKPITDVKLSFKEKELLKIVMKKVKGKMCIRDRNRAFGQAKQKSQEL